MHSIIQLHGTTWYLASLKKLNDLDLIVLIRLVKILV